MEQPSCVHGVGLGTLLEQSSLLLAASGCTNLSSSPQIGCLGLHGISCTHRVQWDRAPAMSSILRDWAVTGKVVFGGNSLASPDAPPSSRGPTRSSSAVACGRWKKGQALRVDVRAALPLVCYVIPVFSCAIRCACRTGQGASYRLLLGYSYHLCG